VAAEYGLQQAVYGLVALAAGYREVTLGWIALDDVAGSPTRAVTAADVPAIEGEIRRALAPLSTQGRPPAATVPQPFCSGCPGLLSGCPVALGYGGQAGAAGGSATTPRL
jgi:hypothetical protein